jgi:hypothetical protein
MFDKRTNVNELNPPPLALENSNAVEVMRVWTAPGEGPHVTLRTTWDDPAAWGVMLVDIARHAANAYAKDGTSREKALAQIKALFDAEWKDPTDEAREIQKQ